MRKGLPKKPRKSWVFNVSGEALVMQNDREIVKRIEVRNIITADERSARKIAGEITPGFVRWKKATVTKRKVKDINVT